MFPPTKKKKMLNQGLEMIQYESTPLYLFEIPNLWMCKWGDVSGLADASRHTHGWSFLQVQLQSDVNTVTSCYSRWNHVHIIWKLKFNDQWSVIDAAAEVGW